MKVHSASCARCVVWIATGGLGLVVAAHGARSQSVTPNADADGANAVTPPMAQETITELMSNELAGFPGNEILMYTVDFPPGFSSPVHRHDAQVSVYVLEGSVVMQVRGGKEVTLLPGRCFYEGPDDIHVVSRNASRTKPAKFLVFLIHKKSTPLVIPAK